MRDVNDTSTMHVTRSLAMSEKASQGAMICVSGAGIGKMAVLENDRRVLVGRDPAMCNLVLSDAKVSRKHLEVTYIDALKKYRVVDYSSNGTYLSKGERLKKNQEYYLEPASELWIGGAEIRYKLR